MTRTFCVRCQLLPKEKVGGARNVIELCEEHSRLAQIGEVLYDLLTYWNFKIEGDGD